MKIAFFGTGLMGTGFVRRLRASGHDVNVWNRTIEKARALKPTVHAFSLTPPQPSPALSASTFRSPTMPRSTPSSRRSPSCYPAGHLDRRPHDNRGHADRRARQALGRARPDVRPRPGFHGASNALEGTGLMLCLGERARATMRSCPNCRR